MIISFGIEVNIYFSDEFYEFVIKNLRINFTKIDKDPFILRKNIKNSFADIVIFW